jgi:hypothetical protein
MKLTFAVRDLLLVTWRVAPESVERSLAPGLEPALTAEGDGLVSAAAFRNTDVRLNGRRGPSFSQLNVRTYVTRRGEPGVFFLSLRVTPAGMGGALFGAPYRPARIRVREGHVRAPGLGVSIRYHLVGDEPDVPELEAGPLGTHDVGYFVAAGLRRLVARHEPFRWRGVELASAPRFDPLIALGFDVGTPDWTLYAAETRFAVQLPPEKVA